jgi:chromosome segregation ATPase
MTSGNKALVILVVASLGLWGCTQGPGSIGGSPERMKVLEKRIARLEEDFRAAATARDQLRQKVARVESQRDQLQKERDDLQQQVVTRTNERDTVQVQYEQFRKQIRSLLGQAETAANGSAAQPVTAVNGAPNPGQS